MSAGFLQRFYSVFPGGEMTLSAGNGVATEAGGVLTLSHTSPAQCLWPNAPVAYKRLLWSQVQSFDTVLKFEARCYGYAAAGLVAGVWQTLFTDRASGDAYFLGWYSGDSKIYASRYNVGNYISTGVVATPATSPHTYRFYYNPTARPLFVQETDGTSFLINPLEVQFWYRVGDAGTWTLLHSRTNELPISTAGLLNFGMSSINGSPWPSATALFNYAGVYQWDSATQIFVPRVKDAPLTNTSVDPKDVAGFEDAAGGINQGGLPAFDSPDGYSDPAIIKDGQPRAGFEDAYTLLKQGGLQPIDFTNLPGTPDVGYSPKDQPVSFEDVATYLLSLEPEFSTATQDVEGHYHFVYLKPYLAVYVDTTNDAWNTPTLNNFTGYARNGYKYTNGVQDAGPVSAPWRTEAAGQNRSSRGDFPLKSLLVVTQRELVIFDLDTFTGAVTTLKIWMRFVLGNTVSDFYALGRGVESIQSVAFSNGLLVVGSKDTGWEVGRLHTVDFKSLTPATVYGLTGSDGQWIGQGTKTIVDRNTNTIWLLSGSYRITPSEIRSLSVFSEGTNTHYIVLSGEDPGPQLVKFVGGVLQSVTSAYGDDIGSTSQGDYRRVLFDDVGWLWFSVGSVLYRNCRDWREGYLYPQKTDTRQGVVDLGVTITKLVYAKDSIYAGTANGVYRIHKGSMQAYLAYTIPGGGGRGRLNITGAGELLAGGRSVIQSLMAYTLLNGSTVIPYLSVGTYFVGNNVGGYTLLRLWDDVVVKSYVSPLLIEPGTFISPTMLA